jgi:integrase
MPKTSALVLSTDRQVQHAKGHGDRTEYRIASSRNLVMRVSPRGSKIWLFLFVSPVTRKHRKMRIGSYPSMGLAQARERSMQLTVEVSQGRDPLLHQEKKAAESDFEQLSNSYLAEQARRNRAAAGESSWTAEVRRLLDRDILPFLRHHKADAVTKADIMAVVQRIIDRGSFGIADKALGVIRAIYTWAAETGRLEIDPTRGLKKRNAGRPRDKVLQEAELFKFWHALQSPSGMTLGIRDAFRLQLLLGVRINEAISCRRTEVDLQRGEWVIPADRNKSRRTHTLPLSDMAIGVFSSALARSSDQTWIFPSEMPGRPLRSKSASRAMLRLSKEIGLEGLRTHDLRRTCATWLGNLDVPDEIIERVLNHAPHSVTRKHYNHASQLESVRVALERWSFALQRIVDPDTTDMSSTVVPHISSAGKAA